MMRLTMSVLLITLLGASTLATGSVVYDLPEGTSASTVRELMEKSAALASVADAKAWAKLLNGVAGSSHSGRIEICLPEETDLDVLDAIVAAAYGEYRRIRLPVVPALISRQRKIAAKAQARAEEAREQMKSLFLRGTGVLDRDKALSLSTQRIEEFRSGIVDARIELAVLGARLGALRTRVKAREEMLREDPVQRLLQEFRDFRTRTGLGPNDSRSKAFEKQIEEAKKRPLPDDSTLATLRLRVIDVEVEEIATEERVKALTLAMMKETDRGLRLLQAKDLTAFRERVVWPAEDAESRANKDLADLELELSGLKSEDMPRRVGK
jgi:hypothetical protein